jgi:uncharacterized protein (TIGR02646 family)
MIKLQKSQQAPASLSSQECRDTLEAIRIKKATGGKVTAKDFDTLYGKEDVRQQLMDDQYKKCAYCEKTLVDEQRHVDHYRPKSLYYELAFTWDNLVGACWACNKDKSNQFPLDDERKRFTKREIPLLINPYLEDPSEYIAFHEEVAVPKKGLTGLKLKKAEKTIELLLKRESLENRRRVKWQLYKEAQKRLVDKPVALQGYLELLSNKEQEFSGMFKYQQ